MKTSRQHRFVAAFLPSVLLLCQCAPSRPPAVGTVPQVASHHWVKISSQPPTYYPRGIATDAPTDCRDGEWVFTEDAQQTRYFIPFHGLGKTPRQTLVQEALSARTPQKVKRIASEQRAFGAGRIISNTLVMPVRVLSQAGVR